jgi:ABC-2 type transport system permease protein
MIAQLSLLSQLINVQLKSQLAYRVSFLFDVAGMVLVHLTEFSAVALVLPRFGDVGGWPLGEIAFLYGLVNLSFGLMDMSFSGFDPDRFGLLVRRGGLDQMMLRPVSLTLQVFGSAFMFRRLGRAAWGLAIFLFGLSLTAITWQLDKLVLVFLVIASQVLYFGGLYVFGATITFWTLDSIEAMNILTYGGSEMLSFPITIYPLWMQRFFTYILPAIFLNYYPALYVMNKPDPLGLPAWVAWLAPLAGLAVFSLALLFWRYGLSKYQSTGT